MIKIITTGRFKDPEKSENLMRDSKSIDLLFYSDLEKILVAKDERN